MEKKRIYQVAKEFHVSSEALISMLHEMGYDIKSHMSVVDDKMSLTIGKQFEKQQDQAHKDIEKKNRIIEAIEKKPSAIEKKPSVPEEKHEAPKHKRRRKRPPKPSVVEEEEVAPLVKIGAKKTKLKKDGSDDKRPRVRFKKLKKKVDMAAVQDSYKKTLASIAADTKSKSKKGRYKHVAADVIVDDRKVVRVSEYVSASELAYQMGIPVSILIAKSMELGMMVSINQRLDMDSIVLLADEFEFEVEKIGEYAEDILKAKFEAEEDENNLVSRPPVVTVMGHVDHGKTTLLDSIRHAAVASSESGGITQHIGAYSVVLDNGQKITFIDTPGHQAFTAMRARGAKATDIVILVVAADDGVMPQTIEAIDHAKAAGVPIVIAINKIDIPGADTERIKGELARQNILVEDWGGHFQSQEISAKKGLHLKELLEKVILESEILELKADPTRKASGVVIESHLDKGRGAIASILVQNGTLMVGDPFIAGMISGNVRAMTDERGKKILSAGPSEPVQIVGMDGIPRAGDTFYIVESEVDAREIANQRRIMKREQDFRKIMPVTLTDLYDKIKDGTIRELNIILKADVDGSVEALSDALSQITHEEVRINIIHSGVGGITENDVLLAAASHAIIIGFQVRPTQQAKMLAQNENIEIKLYNIIYEIIDEVRKALSGLLTPKITESILGSAEVREVFRTPKAGAVAGCYVTNGNIKRGYKARIIRDNIVFHETRINTIRRFKEDVIEVQQGFECGITLEGFNDLRIGDAIEVYELHSEARNI